MRSVVAILAHHCTSHFRLVVRYHRESTPTASRPCCAALQVSYRWPRTNSASERGDCIRGLACGTRTTSIHGSADSIATSAPISFPVTVKELCFSPIHDRQRAVRHLTSQLILRKPAPQQGDPHCPRQTDNTMRQTWNKTRPQIRSREAASQKRWKLIRGRFLGQEPLAPLSTLQSTRRMHICTYYADEPCQPLRTGAAPRAGPRDATAN